MADILLQHDERGFFVRFQAPCREREVVRAAGFRFADGRWTAPSPCNAARLVQQPGVQVTETAAQLLMKAAVEADRLGRQAAEAREASRATDAAVNIPAPAGLAYLPYQRAGIAYMASKAGSLLADEMGLGKTIQAIGLINFRPEICHVLVICPASLKLNWAHECKKWLVRPLRVGIAQSNGKIRIVNGDSRIVDDWNADVDIVIVNYEIVGKLRKHVDSCGWNLLVCDEAHYLKNSKAARTCHVLGSGALSSVKAEPIRADRRVFMTGTPILNRPVELWPIAHALDPGGLGRSFFGFAKRYCAAHNNGWGWDFSGASNLDELQDRLRSAIMVRRLKADVLAELPAKRRQLVPLEAAGALGKVAARMTKTFSEAEDEAGRIRAGIEMAKASGDDAAYKQMVENLRNRQRAAFDELSKLRHETALAKVPAVVEHVMGLLETVDKVVVFAHHQDVAENIAGQLWDVFGNGAAVVVTGTYGIESRQRAVDSFQADPDCRVFVGTIGAAGVGLTLTAASTVVFAELDWVPGRVSQAEDRCHRIGQRDTVLVQHLAVDGTLDARLAQTIVGKQEVLDAALDTPGQAAQAPALRAAPFDLGDLTIVGDDVGEAMEREAAEWLALQREMQETRQRVREAQETALQQRGGEGVADRKVTQRCATQGIDRDALAREGAGMGEGEKAAARYAVRHLANLDPDGALVLNDAGFSKADVYLGHALAALTEPAPAHYAMMRRIALRYPRQVPEAVAILKEV